jgi:hypothetical protein
MPKDKKNTGEPKRVEGMIGPGRAEEFHGKGKVLELSKSIAWE